MLPNCLGRGSSYPKFRMHRESGRAREREGEREKTAEDTSKISMELRLLFAWLCSTGRLQ